MSELQSVAGTMRLCCQASSAKTQHDAQADGRVMHQPGKKLVPTIAFPTYVLRSKIEADRIWLDLTSHLTQWTSLLMHAPLCEVTSLQQNLTCVPKEVMYRAQLSACCHSHQPPGIPLLSVLPLVTRAVDSFDSHRHFCYLRIYAMITSRTGGAVLFVYG